MTQLAKVESEERMQLMSGHFIALRMYQRPVHMSQSKNVPRTYCLGLWLRSRGGGVLLVITFSGIPSPPLGTVFRDSDDHECP